ncbi:MAG: hypothetical protein ACMUHY_04985 [Thermoplasmatota archaeon]
MDGKKIVPEVINQSFAASHQGHQGEIGLPASLHLIFNMVRIMDLSNPYRAEEFCFFSICFGYFAVMILVFWGVSRFLKKGTAREFVRAMRDLPYEPVKDEEVSNDDQPIRMG